MMLPQTSLPVIFTCLQVFFLGRVLSCEFASSKSMHILRVLIRVAKYSPESFYSSLFPQHLTTWGTIIYFKWRGGKEGERKKRRNGGTNVSASFKGPKAFVIWSWACSDCGVLTPRPPDSALLLSPFRTLCFQPPRSPSGSFNTPNSIFQKAFTCVSSHWNSPIPRPPPHSGPHIAKFFHSFGPLLKFHDLKSPY